MKLEMIKHRDILGLVLNDLSLTGEMAEIGVQRGDFSKLVLSQWQGKRYHAVDPWLTQPVEVYRETQVPPEHYDLFYQGVLDFAKQDPRLNVIKDYSVAAAGQFQANQLDCVYIDGNHAYGAVMGDMDAWWTKIRIGGIMGGHDFQNKTDEGWWCEVQMAVMRWTSEHGKVFYVSPDASWWIHKTSA